MNFNEKMRERTLTFAVDVFRQLKNKSQGNLEKSAINQIIRSSASVAANFYAATRSRSDKEFYAKICIVVEECDETLFWFDYLYRSEILTAEEISKPKAEVTELLRIFNKTKQTMKNKLKQE